MLVFTAGIGEHNPVIRERVCAGLGFLGVAIDTARNDASEPVISNHGSRVLVGVEPTNEEWIAALECARLLAEPGR
jgi:acetate kinase